MANKFAANSTHTCARGEDGAISMLTLSKYLRMYLQSTFTLGKKITKFFVVQVLYGI